MQKNHITQSLRIFTISVIFFIFVACVGSAPADSGSDNGESAADSYFILDTLEERGHFQILLEALKQSDLPLILDEGEYSYTFFAPTDAAFQKLPPETLEQLLAGDSKILNDIIYYHVVGKQLPSGYLETLLTDVTFQKASPETLDQFLSGSLGLDGLSSEAEIDKSFLPGEIEAEKDTISTHDFDDWHTPTIQLKTFFEEKLLTVALVESQLKVNNARLIELDLETWNGIIHGIDTILLPVAPPTSNSLIQKIETFLLPLKPLLSEKSNIVNEFEGWYPYEPGKSLSIGDAELVPFAKKARDGIQKVSNILRINRSLTGIQSWINSARTVRLTDSQGTIYLTPIWSNEQLTPERLREIATDGGVIIGLMVVEARYESQLPSDSYVVQIRFFGDNEWFVELVNPRGDVYDGIPAKFTIDQTEMKDMPSTALFYGTIWCEHWLTSFHFCYPCWYNSEAACTIEYD